MFSKDNVKLPLNIDLHLFINVSLIIYNTQHAYGIANALNFWYNHFDIIPITEKKDYTKIVVTNFFFTMFLHWSKNVREIFYHFLCYRLLFWFEVADDSSIDTIISIVNDKLNQIDMSGKIYEQEIFKWGHALQLKKKHIPYNKLLKNIRIAIKGIVVTPDDSKNILRSRKLAEKLNERMRKSSNASEVHHQVDYMINFSEKSKENRTREYKISKKEISNISENQLSYCKRSLSEFERVIARYKQDFENLNASVAQNLPRLAFKLPIDNFEIMENEENQW